MRCPPGSSSPALVTLPRVAALRRGPCRPPASPRSACGDGHARVVRGPAGAARGAGNCSGSDVSAPTPPCRTTARSRMSRRFTGSPVGGRARRAVRSRAGRLRCADRPRAPASAPRVPCPARPSPDRQIAELEQRVGRFVAERIAVRPRRGTRARPRRSACGIGRSTRRASTARCRRDRDAETCGSARETAARPVVPARAARSSYAALPRAAWDDSSTGRPATPGADLAGDARDVRRGRHNPGLGGRGENEGWGRRCAALLGRRRGLGVQERAGLVGRRRARVAAILDLVFDGCRRIIR